MLSRRRPDLILLDLMLPDLDGMAVIRQARSDPELQHVPIVVVSGQEQVTSQYAPEGGVSITRSDGLELGEMLAWIQSIVDTAARTRPQDPVSWPETLAPSSEGATLGLLLQSP